MLSMSQSGHQYFKLTDNDGLINIVLTVKLERKVSAKAEDYDTKEVLVTGNIQCTKHSILPDTNQ